MTEMDKISSLQKSEVVRQSNVERMAMSPSRCSAGALTTPDLGVKTVFRFLRQNQA